MKAFRRASALQKAQGRQQTDGDLLLGEVQGLQLGHAVLGKLQAVSLVVDQHHPRRALEERTVGRQYAHCMRSKSMSKTAKM